MKATNHNDDSDVWNSFGRTWRHNYRKLRLNHLAYTLPNTLAIVDEKEVVVETSLLLEVQATQVDPLDVNLVQFRLFFFA